MTEPTNTPPDQAERFRHVTDPIPDSSELFQSGPTHSNGLTSVGQRAMDDAVASLAARGLKLAPRLPLTLSVQRSSSALERGTVRIEVEGFAVPGTPAAEQKAGALPVVRDEDGEVYVVPAVLGWSNGPGPESLQLYGLDAGPGPRWANPPHGRVVEQSLREGTSATEGDRMLVIRVGSRFVNDERMQRAAAAVLTAVRTELDREHP